jgi:transposase
MADRRLDGSREHQISDELWQCIEPLLPLPKPKKKQGRPRMDDRKAMAAIFFVLRMGCPWKALPRSLGAASTVHDRFQEWRRAGVFVRMRRAGLIGQADPPHSDRAALTISMATVDTHRRQEEAILRGVK